MMRLHFPIMNSNRIRKNFRTVHERKILTLPSRFVWSRLEHSAAGLVGTDHTDVKYANVYLFLVGINL